METKRAGWMTAMEVAEHLNVSLPFIRQLTSRKQIPSHKIGSRSVRYRFDEIESWARGTRVETYARQAQARREA